VLLYLFQSVDAMGNGGNINYFNRHFTILSTRLFADEIQ
jgi:hypothetical protein